MKSAVSSVTDTSRYARFIAIAPGNWKCGGRAGEVPETPLAKQSKPLRWNKDLGYRVRE